jgi:hypothetical protein
VTLFEPVNTNILEECLEKIECTFISFLDTQYFDMDHCYLLVMLTPKEEHAMCAPGGEEKNH